MTSWAGKTHCKRGHRLIASNIIVRKNNRNDRQCRMCAALTQRMRSKKRKELEQNELLHHPDSLCDDSVGTRSR